MALRYRLNTLRLSSMVGIPPLIDLAHHEGYLIPFTIPEFYTSERLERLLSWPPPKLVLPVFQSIPPSATFTRYHTENPLHIQYIEAKKSFWRHYMMWSIFGVGMWALQLHYLINSLRVRWATGAIAAVGAMALTGSTIVVEGNARKMYLDAMKERVMEKEKAFA